jgi:hypothetical protein
MDKTKIHITMKKHFILITICLITGFATAQTRNSKLILLDKSEYKIICSVKSNWVLTSVPNHKIQIRNPAAYDQIHKGNL